METRVIYQAGFPGLAHDQVAGDVPARVAYLLSRHPDARNDYRLVLFYYWLEFDGLGEFMDEKQLARFKVWLWKRATSAKTIQNRCGEVQNDIPALEAAPMVAAKRKVQAKQGRVR